MNSIDFDKFSVRMGTQNDAIKILELINLIQPNDPWTYNYFMWQYFSLEMGDSNLYLIFRGDILVALYAAVKKECFVKGQLKECFMIQDVMTHPDERGQGFLNYLASLCIQDIVNNDYYAYTFPNKLSENSFRRNGWSELTKIPLRELRVSSDGKKSAVMIDQVDMFDHNVESIWPHSGLSIGVNRGMSFLNWRYSRPGTSYIKFLVDKDKGYCVLKLFESNDTRVLHLLDLVVKDSSIDTLPLVLNHIHALAHSMGAEKITCWLGQDHPYAESFDSIGLMLLADHDRYAFVMAPKNDIESFTNLKLWHLTQGDSDVY